VIQNTIISITFLFITLTLLYTSLRLGHFYLPFTKDALLHTITIVATVSKGSSILFKETGRFIVETVPHVFNTRTYIVLLFIFVKVWPNIKRNNIADFTLYSLRGDENSVYNPKILPDL
jgi:hypothetical protein